MRIFCLLLVLCACQARAAGAEKAGVLVKVESGTVYLDIGEAGGAAPGQEFVVYAEGSELKHPKTGESLGRIEREIARGRVESVQSKFSVGQLSPAQTPPSDLQPGQTYKLILSQPPAAYAAPAPSAPQTTLPQPGPTRAPIWRSPAANLEAVGMAVGDVLGDGKTAILLADETRVQAFPDGAADWKPVCSYEDKNANVKILSLDARDFDKDGKAEVFVTLHNAFFGRIETRVLECRDGTFAVAATLPWATRAYPDADGNWRLASQQLVSDRSFPFANIYALEYKDGRYVQTGAPIRLKRLEWLYGFALAKDKAMIEPFHLYYSKTDSIRLQFKKGGWLTPDSYGQTANRVRWHDRPLQFRPRLAAFVDGGQFAGVFTLRNNPGIGGLAGAFGVYNDAELHRLKWNGLSLDPEWKLNLGGYAADLWVAQDDAGRPREVLVAVVGKSGDTSVWKFQP